MQNIKINVPNINDIPNEIISAVDGDAVIASILYNRGITDSKTVKEFLDDSLYVPASLEEFNNINSAVELIVQTINENKNVLIYGDYDADGVTATTLLVSCLKNYSNNVLYHVPDRFSEGYGMNAGVIKKYAEQGVSLVITCDCGISNVEEIALAKNLGLNVIVTDHHSIPEQLPPADIIINPKLLNKDSKVYNLSGCAVAYFLAKAIHKKYNQEEKSEEYLDLVALSIISDVVTLKEENRHLLKEGMGLLINPRRIGLIELYKFIEQKSKILSEEDIAFQVAPRINAAGRLDTAIKPIELLLSKDEDSASKLSREIEFLNNQRKEIQESIINEAIEIIENDKKDKKIIVLYNPNWHHGIMGIAAGRICEVYNRPAILLSLKEDGQTVVGSARSTQDINMYNLLKESQEHLLKYGGHSQAAGLSLEISRIDAFTKHIENIANNCIDKSDTLTINADMELDFNDISSELYNRIRALAPFGEGFQTPTFYKKSVKVYSDRIVKDKHHIMIVGDNINKIKAVKWNYDSSSLEDKNIDIVFKIGENNWNNECQINLNVQQILFNSPKLNEENSFKNINIIDKRNMQIEEVLKEYKDAQVYYEDIYKLPFKIATRYSLAKSNKLILYSMPPSSKILKEVVLLSEAKDIILAFNENLILSPKLILQKALQLIKTIINNSSGHTELVRLGELLNVDEVTIICILEYLKSAGTIDYELIDGIKVFITRGNNVRQNKFIIDEKNLRDKLNEINSFKKFLLNIQVNQLLKFI